MKKPLLSSKAKVRKLNKANKKIKKAGKIARANAAVPGKRAGAARTSAVRKLKSAQRKINKVTGSNLGRKGKARRNPVKAENQKYFGKRNAKAQKLVGKIQNLAGSKKRVAKRTKHLAKRATRVINRKRK